MNITNEILLDWILPKGNLEVRVTNELMAVQEALEETGVKGEFLGPLILVHYWKGFMRKTSQ